MYSRNAHVSINPLFLGRGSINSINLYVFPFMGYVQSFILFGDTSGGPPTTHTWTRNGEIITHGGPFSISLFLKAVSEKYRESVYISRLMVTGRLTGVYQYSVINRAMEHSRNGSITIKGTIMQSSCTEQLVWSNQHATMITSHFTR